MAGSTIHGMSEPSFVSSNIKPIQIILPGNLSQPFKQTSPSLNKHIFFSKLTPTDSQATATLLGCSMGNCPSVCIPETIADLHKEKLELRTRVHYMHSTVVFLEITILILKSLHFACHSSQNRPSHAISYLSYNLPLWGSTSLTFN